MDGSLKFKGYIMENTEIILSISSAALGLLITTVTFLSRFIKSAKAKKEAENLVKICNAIIPFIEEAEGYLNYNGEEKKQYVMTKANQYAIDNRIKFNVDIVSNKIDELVAFTQQVNKRTKNYNYFNQHIQEI